MDTATPAKAGGTAPLAGAGSARATPIAARVNSDSAGGEPGPTWPGEASVASALAAAAGALAQPPPPPAVAAGAGDHAALVPHPPSQPVGPSSRPGSRGGSRPGTPGPAAASEHAQQPPPAQQPLPQQAEEPQAAAPTASSPVRRGSQRAAPAASAAAPRPARAASSRGSLDAGRGASASASASAPPVPPKPRGRPSTSGSFKLRTSGRPGTSPTGAKKPPHPEAGLWPEVDSLRESKRPLSSFNKVGGGAAPLSPGDPLRLFPERTGLEQGSTARAAVGASPWDFEEIPENESPEPQQRGEAQQGAAEDVAELLSSAAAPRPARLMQESLTGGPEEEEEASTSDGGTPREPRPLRIISEQQRRRSSSQAASPEPETSPLPPPPMPVAPHELEHSSSLPHPVLHRPGQAPHHAPGVHVVLRAQSDDTPQHAHHPAAAPIRHAASEVQPPVSAPSAAPSQLHHPGGGRPMVRTATWAEELEKLDDLDLEDVGEVSPRKDRLTTEQKRYKLELLHRQKQHQQRITRGGGSTRDLRAAPEHGPSAVSAVSSDDAAFGTAEGAPARARPGSRGRSGILRGASGSNAGDPYSGNDSGHGGRRFTRDSTEDDEGAAAPRSILRKAGQPSRRRTRGLSEGMDDVRPSVGDDNESQRGPGALAQWFSGPMVRRRVVGTLPPPRRINSLYQRAPCFLCLHMMSSALAAFRQPAPPTLRPDPAPRLPTLPGRHRPRVGRASPPRLGAGGAAGAAGVGLEPAAPPPPRPRRVPAAAAAAREREARHGRADAREVETGHPESGGAPRFAFFSYILSSRLLHGMPYDCASLRPASAMVLCRRCCLTASARHCLHANPHPQRMGAIMRAFQHERQAAEEPLVPPLVTFSAEQEEAAYRPSRQVSVSGDLDEKGTSSPGEEGSDGEQRRTARTSTASRVSRVSRTSRVSRASRPASRAASARSRQGTTDGDGDGDSAGAGGGAAALPKKTRTRNWKSVKARVQTMNFVMAAFHPRLAKDLEEPPVPPSPVRCVAEVEGSPLGPGLCFPLLDMV